MINTLIGNIGHLLVILSFVTSLFTGYSYFKAAQSNELEKSNSWLLNGRFLFYLHTICVFGIVIVLFSIIYNHNFEYHYAWSHSSLHLPTHYMISSFWEGQEGSFLLWIFWHSVLGIIVIRTNKNWEAPVMAVFASVQAFLTSMILGIVIFNIKIGSSPFILLRDAMDDEIFQIDPNFIPADGSGLNPLLQNYWMVIHPPTLFLGFAATLVPFAFLIAGLWKNRFKDWIRPALPWSLFAAAILGLGIIMGAIWAYETLNFGGYWNWDPVENAVYVPWLILVAAIHTMILYRKGNAGLRTSVVLMIGMYVLILYSTFLTRSGILGDTSVHSFTDLGLSGQLLLYLLFFMVGSIILSFIKWKSIPTSEKEISTYSGEFWIFMGAATLCLMGFQVLVPTSIPVFNAIAELFGIESNMAPPADQIGFYSKFQLWFAVAIAVFSGTAQYFWWKKMSKEKIKDELTIPVVGTLLVSIILIPISGVKDFSYLLLMTVGIYSIIANGQILLQFKSKSSQKLSGGSIAHLGIALMFVGVMFSSGYSSVISKNNSGRMIHPDFSDEMNLENILLLIDETKQIGDYEVEYKGPRIDVAGSSIFLSKYDVNATDDPYQVVAQKNINYNGDPLYQKGDTIEIRPENTYYEVEYRNPKGKSFTLFPRAQINEQMGGILASPDIHKSFSKDLYTHVSSIPDPTSEKEWSEITELNVSLNETFFIKDYVAQIENVERVMELNDVELSADDVAIKLTISISGSSRNYSCSPYFIVKNRLVGRIPDEIEELGVEFTVMNVNPEDNNFTLSYRTTQKDYIVLKAMEKPMINLLWTGSILMFVGFVIATSRRYADFKKLKS